jgi:hypothetical protein
MELDFFKIIPAIINYIRKIMKTVLEIVNGKKF